MNDQQRIETAADNCEVLRARLARYEDGEGNPITTIAEQAREIERLQLTCNDLDDQNDRIYAELSALKAQHEQDAQTIKVLQAMARQLKAQPSGVFYTCIGKGGQYEYVGLSDGAGISKGEQLQVYRCTSTGRVFHRECSDFSARMERLNQQPASGGEPFKCDHAACVSLGEHHPFCEYVKQSSGGDERAAFEAFVQREWPGTSIRRRDALPADHERYGEYVNAFVAYAWDSWQARAALSAPSHGEQVREGWQLVPVDPTPEMLAAGDKYIGTPATYKAMLSACPSPAITKDFSQFLSAVMDAAGLIRHGRQSKELSEYLGMKCMEYRGVAPSAGSHKEKGE